MYMVIFRSGEGKPGYHQAEALDEAVRFVERVRNHEQVAEASIFRMTEVPIEFKTYIKVEVVGSAVEDGSVPEEPPVVDEQVDGEPVAPEPVAAASSGPARFGRFRA